MALLNFSVIFIEILYYSLFIKFSKKEGSLWKYILIFAISTILTFIFGNLQLLSYLIIILLPLILGKYIFKIDMKLCDLYIILFMMIIKIIIEGITYNLLFKYIGLIICTIIFEILKFSIIIILNKCNILNKIYLKILKYWKSNNFYIRYFTTIILILYIIVIILAIAFL